MSKILKKFHLNHRSPDQVKTNSKIESAVIQTVASRPRPTYSYQLTVSTEQTQAGGYWFCSHLRFIPSVSVHGSSELSIL